MMEALYRIWMCNSGKQSTFYKAEHQVIIFPVNLFGINIIPKFRFMVKPKPLNPMDGAYSKIKVKDLLIKVK